MLTFDYLLNTLDNQLLEAKNAQGLTPLDLIEKDEVHYIQSLLDNYRLSAKIADELLQEESKDRCGDKKKRRKKKTKKSKQ